MNNMLKFLSIACVSVLFSLFMLHAQPEWSQTLVCSDYSQGKVFILEKGEIVWEHDAPLSNDVWMLANGNLLFTTGHGVLEVTRSKDTVFCYQSSSYVFACQRLSNGNTFVGECNTGKLLEISPKGEIVKEVCILPEGTSDAGMGFMRNARRLKNGHYLVAHYAGKKVVEYDKHGKIYWEAEVSGGAHSVVRSSNGHTLVAVADADKNPRIMEFDKKGRKVWEISNADFSEKPFKFLGGVCLLQDGTVVFANWQGHGTYMAQPHLFGVDHEKHMVFTLDKNDGIKTISSVFIPGQRHMAH